MIEHLLLVEGPSGAGKSTFMEHLASGALPESIRAALPPDASKWQQIDSEEFDRWLEDNKRYRAHGGTYPGLVVHFDLMFPVQRGLPDYKETAVNRLVQLAEAITVVRVRSTATLLSQRVSERECGSRWPFMMQLVSLHDRALRQWWRSLQKAASFIARGVPRSVKARGPIPRWREALARQQRGNLRLLFMVNALKVYRQPNGLELWCRKWEQHLSATLRSPAPLCVIAIAPAEPAHHDGKSWQLVHDNW
jgi:hypothetical protein